MKLKITIAPSLLMLAPFLAAAAPPPAAPAGARQKLDELVAELQSEPDDHELREKIIAAALKMKPKPAVSKEAQRFLIRGTALFKIATADEQYDKAAAEFQKAIAAAPWWVDAYFNLAAVQEKAGNPDAAISNLKLYLAGKPADADEVERKVIELEVLAEELAPIKRLEGDWGRPDNPTRYRLATRGRAVTMTITEPNPTTEARAGDISFAGEFQGATLVGKLFSYTETGSDQARCFGGREEFPITGSAEGDSITLRYRDATKFDPRTCTASVYQEKTYGFTRKR